MTTRHAKFEVLIVVLVKIYNFWAMTLCQWASSYQRLEGSIKLLNPDDEAIIVIRKVKHYSL
jgi:hypothetical protein